MNTTSAMLDVLRRAEELARTHNDGNLADDLYGLGCALGSANHRGDLVIIAWSELDRMWTVSARASDESDWSMFEGAEDELDTLLSLARDCATGG